MSELLEVGELEFRREATLTDVSFPKRTIELVVMPYEETSVVDYRGRAIEEVITRGAFDGVERRTGQIRVNRGHDLEDAIGKAVALHPSRAEGLVAEVKVSRTDRGEEALILAEDGVLGASAGFALMRENGRTGRLRANAEVWETRSRRRLNHLWLDHIALTPDPAYAGASVLSVRHAPANPQEPVGHVDVDTAGGTPNLDRIAYDAQKALYDELNRRYISV